MLLFLNNNETNISLTIPCHLHHQSPGSVHLGNTPQLLYCWSDPVSRKIPSLTIMKGHSCMEHISSAHSESYSQLPKKIMRENYYSFFRIYDASHPLALKKCLEGGYGERAQYYLGNLSSIAFYLRQVMMTMISGWLWLVVMESVYKSLAALSPWHSWLLSFILSHYLLFEDVTLTLPLPNHQLTQGWHSQSNPVSRWIHGHTANSLQK